MRISIACVGTILLYLSVSLFAAPPRSALTKLGVDLVSVKDGPRLRGAVLNRSSDATILMAVQRGWLREVFPDFYAEKARLDKESQVRDQETLMIRIREWMKGRAKDADLVFFLKKELERLGKVAKDDAKKKETQFILLEIPAKQIARVYIQPRLRKQIVLIAWRDRLDDPERRPIAELARELARKGIDPTKEVIDLSDRLPPRGQSEHEWAARKAVVEYQFRKGIDFQGTGSALFRTGEDVERANIAKVVSQLLQQQSEIDGLIAELLGKPKTAKKGDGKAIRKAISEAGTEDAIGLRITRLKNNISARRVTVQSELLARMPDNSWKAIWKHSITKDASKPRPDLEERIKNDPQVKKIFEIVEALGLDGLDGQINLALRFGAATMDAQAAAESAFFEFRDRYLRRLDGPPLRW